MLRISDTRLDYLLTEDVPYFDLTTFVLDIGKTEGVMEYYTREDCLLCGTEEVIRIMKKLDLEVESAKMSGTFLSAGESFLRVKGKAENLHNAWKVCLNLFDHCSAVATKTEKVVRAVKAENPLCEVLVTRKSQPGIKDLLIKSVMTGGAIPHRLGLSETVLVFDQHLQFLGGKEGFLSNMPFFKSRCSEKKLFVESTKEDAFDYAEAGVDGLQFDKLSPAELAELVPKMRTLYPEITLIAAGGINPENAASYASSGVDGLVTTALYTARPLDMSVRMERVE